MTMVTDSELAAGPEDCALILNLGAVPEGDADVSGIGVILAFIISAYVTFVTVLLAYLLGMIDPPLLGAVDTAIFNIRYRGHQSHHMRRRTKYLRKLVLTLSDQQIFTGIAIMAAGFHGLSTRKMSVYHFQVVLYLAWMSSSVHLSAITLLQAYLHRPRRRGILVWRLCGMIVLMVMLLLGLVPTISNDWGIAWWEGMLDGRTGWAIPAVCFWGQLWGDGVGPDAPLGFVILVVSYMWKMGGLFDGTRSAWQRFVRHPVELRLIRFLARLAVRVGRGKEGGKGTRVWLWLFRVVVAAAVPFVATLEMAASFAASLWLSLLSLAYGTIQILVPRIQMLQYTDSIESSWGFGQLVPLILLAQPVGVVCEYLWAPPGEFLCDDVDDREHNQHERQQSQGHGSPMETRCSVIDALTDGPPRISEELEQLSSTVLAVFFSSKLFAANIYLLQIALVITSGFTFWFDILTIGNDRTDNWEFIFFSIGAFGTFSFLVTFAIVPFSVIGHSGRPR